MQNNIQIVDYLPVHKKAFIAINEAWITRDYDLEEIDKDELYNLETSILKGGGAILIAMHNNMPVGTCALVKMDSKTFELIKMAVDVRSRGLKIGRLLGVKALAKAKELGATRLILHSNTKTSGTAVALYYELGFKKIPMGETVFQRADIKMQIDI